MDSHVKGAAALLQGREEVQDAADVSSLVEKINEVLDEIRYCSE